MIRPRDDVQPEDFFFFFPEDFLNMFLGCSVRDWDLGFVGLAATTITNLQTFWKVFRPGRKAGLWYYNYSAEQEFLGDRRRSEGESQAGGDPGAGLWRPGRASSLGFQGNKSPLLGSEGLPCGKGRTYSVWSQRVELSEWVDFVKRQIPIQNRGDFLTRSGTQHNAERLFSGLGGRMGFMMMFWKFQKGGWSMVS